jgi:hypothetical protein
MKFEVALGLIRHVLTLVGGYYVASGKLDPTSADTIVGAVTALVGTGWSIKHKIK